MRTYNAEIEYESGSFVYSHPVEGELSGLIKVAFDVDIQRSLYPDPYYGHEYDTNVVDLKSFSADTGEIIDLKRLPLHEQKEIEQLIELKVEDFIHHYESIYGSSNQDVEMYYEE